MAYGQIVGCGLGMVLAVAGGATAGKAGVKVEQRIVVQRTIEVDGDAADWEGIDAISLTPDAEGVTSSGAFDGAADLTATVHLAWDDENLYALLQWRDDVIDTRRRARADATWTDSQGKRRDAMYHHDNLSMRISSPDFFYRVWLAPSPDSKESVQWDRLRPTWRRFSRVRPDQFPNAPEVKVSAGIRGEASVTVLELKIPWRKLERTPSEDEVFSLSLTAPDADVPGADDLTRSEQVSYLDWSGTIVFETESIATPPRAAKK